MKTLLDLIIDGAKPAHRTPFRWRQNFATGDMPFTACELATDGIRMAAQRVDIAPEEPMPIVGALPPRAAAVWPKAGTLPNKINLTADACAVVAALAKVQSALTPKGRNGRGAARIPTAEFEPAPIGGNKNTKLTISAAHACIETTLYGVTMDGGPIRFNLTYLAQALDPVRGSIVRFDDATRPALIGTRDDGTPADSVVSILMPVTPERK